jgi:hypothetical protein
MLESILILLVIIAIILLIVTVEWESILICMIDLILWASLAVAILQVEIPYQYTSGGTVVEATQSIETLYPLAYLFIGIALIVLLYLIFLIFGTITNRPIKGM